MVTNATSLGKSGLSDWLVQRVSAVILGAYFVVMVGFFITAGEVGYAEWHGFMSTTFMKIFTLLALMAMAGHAWIGIWTASTDYLTARQMPAKIATPLRLIVEYGTILLAVVYVLWGAMILWGA